MNCHLQVTAENFNELFEIKANMMLSEVQQCSPPPFTQVVCSQSSFKMTNHCNQSGSGVPVKHLKNPSHCPVYSLFHAISATICLGVNSPGFDWRYFSQVFHLLGRSEDPGWTLTFLIKPHGCVVAPHLFNNQAEGKVMASEHSVEGAILDSCLCAQEVAFVAAKVWARVV